LVHVIQIYHDAGQQDIKSSSICYVLDWGKGKTNITDSRNDVHLTSPHSEPPTPVREVRNCFHSTSRSGAHRSRYP